ncbi:hypothetical protein BB560_003581 [Smittium megazygosporum]|uniref:Glycosyl transferase CAP10 domain-containing protein n=1 Tax=Smittium megazygosporum TaxID=133381 RepID=A0A2T9ZBJ0_9FUNG|nr:hypothetical protein BB560_003581 [Smittium megazygosporum]
MKNWNFVILIVLCFLSLYPSLFHIPSFSISDDCPDPFSCDRIKQTSIPVNFMQWLYSKLLPTYSDLLVPDKDSSKKDPEEDFFDFDALGPDFSRLPDWPTSFPPDLVQYRIRTLNSTFASNQLKWKAEVAPWVVHHRGVAENLYLHRPDPREKAAIVVLVRNSELRQLQHSIRMMEDRFNRVYNYPYIFLNDKPFSNKFIQTIAKSTSSSTTFSLIPYDHWSIPDSVNFFKAKVEHRKLSSQNVPYGGSMSYRHMCRFNSGFFYKHPLLQDLDFYWRLEPDIDFYCDLDFDPFKFMRENNKVYSFVIFLTELEKTIPSLWESTLQYAYDKNISSNSLKLFADKYDNYNLCHFWSNFEIASLKWFRSDEYESYFQHLDKSGNFFYERWGDAPIHSLAAGLLLDIDQIHFFNEIGYRHDGFARWPVYKNNSAAASKCMVPSDRFRNFDIDGTVCSSLWEEYKPYPWDIKDTENALNKLYLQKLQKPSDQNYMFVDQKWRDAIYRN